jgi:hypothetical protein
VVIAAPGFDVPGPGFDISFRRPPLAERNHAPLLLGIGDPTYGPLIGLFFDAPSTNDELAGPADLTPAHSHPCDNFRVVMVGELWVGPDRYHHGEFRLQRSARPYGADGDAPHRDGCWRIISFADRRGSRVRPTNAELRAQVENEESLARERAAYGDLMPEILPVDDMGIDGLLTTIDKPWSKVQHINGGMTEAYSWPKIGEASTIAVSLMAHHEVGPIYALQRTAAGAEATPAMTFGSDVFRCVIGGSLERDGATAEMGDCRVQEAGVPWSSVVAGSQGLDELIVIGDRRGAAPTVLGDDRGRWAASWDQLVEGLLVRLLHDGGEVLQPLDGGLAHRNGAATTSRN